MFSAHIRVLAFLAASAVTFSTGLALAQVTGPLNRTTTTVDRPAPQAAPAPAAAAASKELVCRGALNAFAPSRWDDAVAGISKLQINFSHSTTPPGSDGKGMQPGTCAWSTGVMSGADLHQVNFVENPGGPTVQGRAASGAAAAGGSQMADSLNDPNRFWRFTIDGQQYGWYLASDHGPWQPSLGAQVASPAGSATSAGKQTVASTALPRDLFQKPDAEMFDLGGRSVRAGDVKRQLQPDLDSLITAPVAKAASRGTNAEGSAATAAVAGTSALGSVQQLNNPAAGAIGGVAGTAGGGELEFAGGEKLNCENEQPVLTVIKGKIAPGAQFTLLGFCLGDRAGRIEAIGQVPGGKLALETVVWRHDVVVVNMPELSGVSDQNLAFSAVRADGAQSAPRQARMTVARVRVEVPPSYWAPQSFFDESLVAPREVTAQKFRATINSACAFETMQAHVTAGSVLTLWGFDRLPAHVADIGIDSQAACKTTDRITDNGPILIDDWERTTVCRTRYDLTAVALCPAGIKP